MFDATTVYNKPDFCDFIITLKDGRELYCHKVILAAGSEMFRSFMNKDRLDDASIPFDDYAVEFCIKYIYGFRAIPQGVDLDTIAQIITCSRYLLIDSLYDWFVKNQVFFNCLDAMSSAAIVQKLYLWSLRDVNVPERVYHWAFGKVTKRLSTCYDEKVWTERGTPEPGSGDAAEITRDFFNIAKLGAAVIDGLVKFLVGKNYHHTAIVLKYIHNGELSPGDSFHLVDMCDFYLDVMCASASESDRELIIALKRG